ncbi:hypothetical protein ACOMHN_040932 [Nucella lapillus]
MRLNEKLTRLLSTLLPDFEQEQLSLNDRLRNIVIRLKGIQHTVGDQSATLAGEKFTAEQQESLLTERFNRIQQLDANSRRQPASLEEMKFSLREVTESLDKHLSVRQDQLQSKITALNEATNDTVNFIHYRHCFAAVRKVDLSGGYRSGQVTVPYPADLFQYSVPTAHCTISGFVSALDPQRSHRYGFQDEIKGFGVKVDCRATEENVVLSATGISKGGASTIHNVNVQVRLCNLGPQSITAHNGYGRR